MTTIFEREATCSHCGTKNLIVMIGSTNRRGYPDLDLRPPEMQRSTMHAWKQACQGCGFVANDISQMQEGIDDLLRSEGYRSIRTSDSLPELTARFWCAALIDATKGDHGAAFQSMLCAAWAADDLQAADLAQQCRRLAIEHFQRDPGEKSEARLQLLDVMRRAGLWVQAEVVATELQHEHLSKPLKQIVEFQAKLLSVKDARCYSVGDALA